MFLPETFWWSGCYPGKVGTNAGDPFAEAACTMLGRNEKSSRRSRCWGMLHSSHWWPPTRNPSWWSGARPGRFVFRCSRIQIFEKSAIVDTGNPNDDAVLTDRLLAVPGMSVVAIVNWWLTAIFTSRIPQNILFMSSRSRRTNVNISNVFWHSSC